MDEKFIGSYCNSKYIGGVIGNAINMHAMNMDVVNRDVASAHPYESRMNPIPILCSDI